MKRKKIAAVLAFFLGMFGAHRFYLGQRFLGIVICFFTVIAFIITVEEHVPLIVGPAIFAFVESVLFLVMPREEFDEKYNARYLKDSSQYDNYEFDELGDIQHQDWSYKSTQKKEADQFSKELKHEAASFAAMPLPKEEEAEEAEEKLSLDLLDQIAHYGRLKEQGLLTDEEFEHLKQRLL